MKRKSPVFFIFILVLFFVFENISINAYNVSEEKFKVLYDGYHSVYGALYFNRFNSRLPDQFIVEYTYKPLTEERLSGCDMLGICHPIEAYSAEEIYYIKKFVEEGGGLLVTGCGWSWVDYFYKSIEEYPLNQIAQEFGVTMNDDFITDPTDYHTLDDVHYPVFTNFAVHPVTEGLSAVYAGWPSSFSITGNAIPIVMGDEDAYSANYHHPVYAAGDFPPIAVALEYNKGRAIFLGNDGFIDICIDDYDNYEFGLNIFYWLCEPSSSHPIDNDNDGYSSPQDCNDYDPSVYPGATEICDGKDNDCDGQVDEGFDKDGDGYTTCAEDCDDNDPNIHPGATEICDGKDNDCDGQIDEGFDKDGDGYTSCQGDCNDVDATMHPGATEICDGKDNDCDGQIDEGFDKDGDGYTSCAGDCDDKDPSIYPGATELDDGKDNDCDGQIDAGIAKDNDNDGYSSPQDCNDYDPSVYPGATEICDGKDNDCDGQIDEGFDKDGDGYTTCAGDCDDNDPNIHPGATEICDGKDNDCDGQIDEGFDKDGDGYAACAEDCDDNDPNIHPGATEICDGKDNDCDGLSDEGTVKDNDKDGYLQPQDCNDKDPSVHPGAEEICDEKDNDCDGKVNEGLDKDGDGYPPCNGDCNDKDPSIYPGAKEICDGEDNDCDREIDEGCQEISLPILGGILVLFLISLVMFGKIIKPYFYSPAKFTPIHPNPYVAGNPIRSRDIFFGREDVFQFIMNKLSVARKNISIVLHGERRTGKTSILYQIEDGELGEKFIPVYIDLQEMAKVNEKEFFAKINDRIVKSLVKFKIIDPKSKNYPEMIKTMKEYEIESNAYLVLSNFLDKVSNVLEEKYLILMFDEYEILEKKIKSNNLSSDLIQYLRSQMQSRERFSFIFTGSKKLEDLEGKSWSLMFNVATYKKISFLEKKDALDLMRIPVDSQIHYTGEAIDKIIRLTACHPYFLQLFLQNLIDHLNDIKKDQTTIEEIMDVLRYILDNPPPHMIYIWQDSTDDQKVILSALSEIIVSEKEYIPIRDIEDRLRSNGMTLDADSFKRTLYELHQKDILDCRGYERYNFKIDLLRYWIRIEHPLFRTREEIK